MYRHFKNVDLNFLNSERTKKYIVFTIMSFFIYYLFAFVYSYIFSVYIFNIWKYLKSAHYNSLKTCFNLFTWFSILKYIYIIISKDNSVFTIIILNPMSFFMFYDLSAVSSLITRVFE